MDMKRYYIIKTESVGYNFKDNHSTDCFIEEVTKYEMDQDEKDKFVLDGPIVSIGLKNKCDVQSSVVSDNKDEIQSIKSREDGITSKQNEVLGKIYLTKNQAHTLAQYLQYFAEHGELPYMDLKMIKDFDGIEVE